jgi:predicted DNA binding protein
MTRLPIFVESGYQKHVILAPSNLQLSILLKELRSKFTEVRIMRVTKIPSGVSYSPLTEKQQNAFKLAYDSGYFEMPRRCKLSELADKLGIKRVAMQERLRRAEIKIVREFVEIHS